MCDVGSEFCGMCCACAVCDLFGALDGVCGVVRGVIVVQYGGVCGVVCVMCV